MGSDCVLSGLCYLGQRIKSKHSNIFSLSEIIEKLMQNTLINEMWLMPKYIWPCPWKRNEAWQLLNLSVQCVKEDGYTFKTDLKRRWIFCTFDILRNKQSFWQMVSFSCCFCFALWSRHWSWCYFVLRILQIGNRKKAILIIVISLKTILYSVQFSSVQLLSRDRLFATPWIAARQASQIGRASCRERV